MNKSCITLLFLTFAKLSFASEPIPALKEYLAEEIGLPSIITSEENVVEPPSKVKVCLVESEACRWKLLLEFPETVVFKQEYDCDSLYLEFNQPVDLPDLSNITEKLSYVIQTISSGYHSLRFKATRPLLYRTATCGKCLTVEIIADYALPVEETRLLQLARARYLIENRELGSARRYIADLMEEYPCDKDVFVLYASLEQVRFRWQTAVQTYQILNDCYPEDDDIDKLLVDSYNPHAPFIAYGFENQHALGLSTINIHRLQAERILSQSCYHTRYVGLEVDTWHGDIGDVVDGNGVISPFDGTRTQGSAYLRNEWAAGGYLGAWLYMQEASLGTGLAWNKPIDCLKGSFTAEAHWHRPYWGVYEAMASNGREDMFRVNIDSIYSRRINWQLAGGMHRVGISGLSNGFTSAQVAGEFFYNLRLGNPILAFNYGLDAEYVTDMTHRNGVNGDFEPVPFTSFENHSLRLYLYYTWRDNWFFTLFGGGTFNRLGTNSPTGGISLRYVPTCPRFEIELSASRYPNTLNQGGGPTDSLSGRFILRF